MMKHKIFHISLLVTTFFGIHGAAFAQIQIGGLADFELRKAGDHSSPYINQTPGSKLSLYTPNIRLFISGSISENWFTNLALQSDYYNSNELSSPFFSVLNLNYAPESDSDFMVTVGRFITPYGVYSERVLSSDNPFVHLPLTHASGLPISKRIGFFSGGTYNPEISQSLYGENETGLTMVYQRMYTQGIKISGNIGETEWLSYNLGATLAPASTHLEYGQYNKPALTGRIFLKPTVWAQLGFSLSTGAFLKEDTANDTLLAYDLSSYNQNLLGADLKFSYRYYTLLFEYNHSYWKAPYYDPGSSTSATRTTGEATIGHVSGEFIVNFPFLVGSYAALRYETMSSGDIETYTSNFSYSSYSNLNKKTWTYDRERIEFVAGYKLQRNIILKASYLYSDDSGPDLDDNVFTLQLSVLF
ncbi:MAG: hypothetical protein HUJ22_05845 [Gracilimonas sp.]|uniref:hypothetical protein n=1 Tax=Gracilimonas sp. TaxID=1974203 RepID=UPI0019982F26|nr:hypothetical protein [Gracilimonas sp.]MBD3616078.1 hypothetical protein [Gracilimonas sp.]